MKRRVFRTKQAAPLAAWYPMALITTTIQVTRPYLARSPKGTGEKTDAAESVPRRAVSR